MDELNLQPDALGVTDSTLEVEGYEDHVEEIENAYPEEDFRTPAEKQAELERNSSNLQLKHNLQLKVNQQLNNLSKKKYNQNLNNLKNLLGLLGSMMRMVIYLLNRYNKLMVVKYLKL